MSNPLAELNLAQQRAVLAWLDGPDTATVGEVRQQVTALADAPACTDLTAA